ncbi:F-box only protein 25-like [Mercenaria mercenaria]|uniref:F-box only protein 25-like n=1 Tax=Mercenaria mercenaria TaxID=6596 RepID=UPI00234E877E|nr:F-box only protein 25-like [Mercenaria mercenaria]
MADWIKTARGWVLRELENTEYRATQEKINARSQAVSYDREVSIGRNVKATGTKGQRKLSVCVSEFIEYMALLENVTDIRTQAYLNDFMMLLMTKGIGKASGCAHRQLFKILEAMVIEAMNSETNIIPMKNLLVCTMKSMVDESTGRIGSKSLWNRHIQTVANLSTKMEQFVLTERVEDGLPTLTDLPKECIREIMLKLSDHRDIINLGKTCSELYYVTQDSSIWQKLVQYHFSEKQMSMFIEDTEYIDSTVSVWQHLHHKCSKKFGLKKTYTDQLVICSACKTLHWMMQGHTCWSAKKDETSVYLEPVGPNELFSILFSSYELIGKSSKTVHL